MKFNRKSIFSWALYDWANSAFATTVIAGFFPIFFKKYWSNPNDPTQSTFYLGLANSIASTIVALLSPFIGAISDTGFLKKKFLFFFTYLGILMTSLLFMVNQGQWQFACLLFVLASIGFWSSLVFYDSLLVNIAPKEKIDFVSLFGYALGYIGGGILFLLNVLMYLKPIYFKIPDSIYAIRLSFLTVGIWWALFSIPIFIFVKEPIALSRVNFLNSIALGWRQLFNTFKDLKNLRVVMFFLFAYWFYIDGVQTIIKMAVDYGVSLNFPVESLIIALLLVQFISFPSSLLYNIFSKLIGAKKAILISITGYCLITIFGFFMKSVWHFYVLAIMVALFQGGIQALSRSLFCRIIPKNKLAEFFGFYNMLGKFSAILGPFLVGITTYVTGNNRYGILSILILLIIGAIILISVDIKKGEQIANDYKIK